MCLFVIQFSLWNTYLNSPFLKLSYGFIINKISLYVLDIGPLM